MMSSKEVKARLKAAKAAVDKKDFKEVQKCCQDVFRLDETNYTAHVFCGLACLQLGSYEESRQHYKAAISKQPDGPLAWKGLADYYDKHRAVIQEERLEAIETYSKLLTFIPQDDYVKRASTLQKLTDLHRVFGNHDNILQCYSDILSIHDNQVSSGDPVDVIGHSKLCAELTTYLLSRQELSSEAFIMLDTGFGGIEEDGEIKMELRPKYIKRIFDQYMSCDVPSSSRAELIKRESVVLLSHSPQLSLPVLVRLTIMESLSALVNSEEVLNLPEEKRQWFTQLYGLVSDCNTCSQLGGTAVCLGWAGQAVVCVADGKWQEARTAVQNSVACTEVLSECWLLSSHIHCRLYDYHTTEQAAVKGLKGLAKSAKFLSSILETGLKLHLSRAYLGTKDTASVEQALLLLSDVMSHDLHVIELLVKAYISLDKMEEAREALQKLATVLVGDSAIVLGLQGEVFLRKKDFPAALERFDLTLKQKPGSSLHHFLKGLALWNLPDGQKKQAYAAFLQAARSDPFNPEVFLYLGHYQKLVTKDLKRATKCYQKAVELQPSNAEAAMNLADTLSATGEEDEAFGVYKKITSDAPPSKTKYAWLRMGLFYRKNHQYNDAIKCFHTVLTVDSTDKHYWECLGEAYLARGSYNSALRTFTKCLELDPQSIYCRYEIANIRKVLGLLGEAVSEYTAVLELDPNYVPALKGRGESWLLLTQEALKNNFDGKAVDCTSSSLVDLTYAAHLQPHFMCLWKLIGDSCVSLHPVASDVARPSIPLVLKGDRSASLIERAVADKVEILQIGCRAYGRALQLSPESPDLWHDLAAGYFYLGQESTRQNCKESREHFETALKAIKKAICLDPRHHTCWNTLGIIAATPEVNNTALAQHAFIKSIQEEPNNVIGWTNLGTLYLTNHNIKLAHEAFKNAQSRDPNWTQAWIGQALIAESIGNTAEAMDLLRHATELGYHSQGSIGYSYWVCQTLCSIDPKLILAPGEASLNDVALRALLQARDCLQMYTLREKLDTCAYNLLGLLYEQEGLLKQAENSFAKALQLCKSDHSTLSHQHLLSIEANRARVISALGRHTEATTVITSICKQTNDPIHRLQLALVQYRAQCFSKSYQAYLEYMSAEEENTNEEEEFQHLSTLLTAQAMIAFAESDREKCKTLLYQAFQTKPVSLHGLVALCVLGYLSNDLTLILAVLEEIDKIIEWQPDSVVVLHPSCVQALKIITFMLDNNPQAAECVQKLLSLTQKLPDSSLTMSSPLPITLHSLLNASSPNDSVTTVMIQKLIHTYPTNVWSLAILVVHISQPELRTKYLNLLLSSVEAELNVLKSKEVGLTQVEKNGELSLTMLKKWTCTRNL